MATPEMPSPENETLDSEIAGAKKDKAKDVAWFYRGLVFFVAIVIVVGTVVYLKSVDEVKNVKPVVVTISPTPTVIKIEEVVVNPKKVVRVEVLNGSGVVGAAKKMSERLKAKDKTLNITVGNNSEEVKKTVVIYKDSGFKNGEFPGVAKEVWPGADEKVDSSISTDVRVIFAK